MYSIARNTYIPPVLTNIIPKIQTAPNKFYTPEYYIVGENEYLSVGNNNEFTINITNFTTLNNANNSTYFNHDVSKTNKIPVNSKKYQILDNRWKMKF